MDSPDITAHDLRLLSVGYYIQAGIAAFYTLIVLGYFVFLGAMLSIASANNDTGQNIPPAFLTLMSTVLAIILLFACLYTVALFLAAQWLRRSRNMLFIQVVAALSCLAIPYGTLLGIFTFMVLLRPSAKLFFSNTPLSPPISTDQPPA
jgi:hypothetical protein